MDTKGDYESGSILLGRTFESTPRIVDRRAPKIVDRRTLPVSLPVGGGVFTMERESHLITIAPTGAGKGRSVIIPNLLTYPGPIVVTDPKGENYAVTAEARRIMGHAVMRLDPFHVTGPDSDSLNPLELFSLADSEIETDAQMLADLLSLRKSFNDFWENSAFGLLSGIIGYVAAIGKEKPGERTFTKLITTLNSDDVVYNLAVLLDTIGKQIPKMAYMEISSFLQKADKERSGVLSTTTAYLKALMSANVLKSLDESSISLTDIIEGKPLSIYLIIPPAKLKSHFTLLRLWIGTILHCITSRRVIPEHKTLFILDECAQLGTFSALETAITLCRGYGLQVWTFWQDLSQIRSLYPTGWPTMINNCGAVQIFGAKNSSVSSEAAKLLGIEAEDIRLLENDDQIVCLDSDSYKIKKLDYLNDSLFTGRFNENPFHARRPTKV